MKELDTSYTGGREMSTTEWFEFTDIDRAKIRHQELREEKFLRDAEAFNDHAKQTLYEMLKGILMLAATLLFCLAGIIWKDQILDFFRNLLN
ncbi:MAG TPA: hypothetical protein VD907_06840 [Verrucomicrobiae bacterium]|nr:hypothetical protein [Verrucomicrobiae bacterium]